MGRGEWAGEEIGVGRRGASKEERRRRAETRCLTTSGLNVTHLGLRSEKNQAESDKSPSWLNFFYRLCFTKWKTKGIWSDLGRCFITEFFCFLIIRFTVIS